MHLAMLEHGKSSLLHSLFWGNPFGKIRWEKLIIQEGVLSWVSKWDQEEYCVGCDTGSQEFKKCFQWATVFERKQKKKNKIRSRLKCGWVHSPQVWEAVARLHQFFSATFTFPFSLLKFRWEWQSWKCIEDAINLYFIARVPDGLIPSLVSVMRNTHFWSKSLSGCRVSH